MNLFSFKNDGRSPSFLFTSVLLLYSLSALCQVNGQGQSIHYSGIVKDSLTNEPIEFVHVYLPGTSIGTVTNNQGEFLLIIPEGLTENTVSFSYLGYKSKNAKPESNSNALNVILLTQSAIELNEVIVTATGFDSALYILDTAIKFIKFNYPAKPHLMEGFFRELSLKDTSYTRLIEAAVRIQEVGYNKTTYDNGSLEMTRNRVKVIELRKSDDFRDTDLLSKALNLLFGDRNELYMILNKNFVRVLGKKSNHSLSEENIKHFDLEYTGRTEWEGEPVYILSLKDFDKRNFQWTEYIFYIKKTDHAIVRIDHKSSANPARKDIQSKWLIDGKYFSTSQIAYRKINSKYFPVFIQARHSPAGASSVVKEDGKELKQYADIQFLLTNVYEDNYSKIKWKNAEDRDKDLYENDTPYNEEFWKNYNTVKINPLKRNPTELEKKQPLNNQFKKNN